MSVDDDVRKAAQRWKKIIEKELSGEEAKVQVHVDTAKAKKELEKASEDQLVLFEPEVDKSAAAKTEAVLDEVAHDRTVEYKADVDEASVARAGKKISSNLQMASGTGKGFFNKGGNVNLPFRATIPLPVVAQLSFAAGGAVPIIGSMVQSVGQLTGAIGLLPAAIGAAGLAIGTLRIGISGFGDAMKSVRDPEKFAEALKELAPAAQEAAIALQGLMPQVLQLRATVQNALFTGMGEEFSKLGNTYLPIFQDVMSRMASSASTAFGGLSKMLQTPEMQADIKTFGANASQAFSNLLQAVNPLVKAFTDIATVGSSFLPELSSTVADLAKQFGDFIGEARESGKLAEWIQNGITAFTQLKDIGVNVWNIFKGIFEAAGGGDFLQTVMDLTSQWTIWVNSVEGQTALKDFFDEAKESLKKVWDLAVRLGPILYDAFLGMKLVMDQVLPIVTQIAGFIEKYPGWIQTAGAMFATWKLVSILSDITKIGTALLGLSATAETAGAGIGAGLARGLALNPLTLTITLAVAGGALAIWAGQKLLEGGKTIQLPVGDVGGSGLNPVSDNLSVKSRTGDLVRENRTALQGPPTGPAYAPTISNLPPTPHGGVTQDIPRVAPSPNALPDVSQQPAPPQIAGPPVNLPSSGGGGGGGAGGKGPKAPEVAPPGMSYDYSGYGELNWDALAELEAGGNPKAISKNGVYKGLYQFDDATWASVGGTQFAPTADQATEDEQTKCATALYNSRGIAPWPVNGWVLEANEDQLKAAGLTSTGRRRSNAGRGGTGGNRGRGRGGYGGGYGGAPQPRVPYGMPAGSNSGGYGGSGVQFPSWVGQITSQFGVKPSTYPGHQESGGLNKGIDWKGTPAQMRELAEWAMAHPEAFEQLIYWDPETGKKYGLAGGQPVGPGTSQPGYYASDWGEHGGPGNVAGAHVHTRQSESWGPQFEPDGGYSYDGPGGSQGDPMYVRSSDTSGEQLGRDIVSGVMEIFGFGDLFKDPTQFGLFKIFKAIMGIRPGGGDLDNGYGDGSGGGGAGGLFGLGSGGSGGGGGLLDFVGQFIPGNNGSSIADDIAGWQGQGTTGGISPLASDLSNYIAPGGPGTVINNRNITVEGDAAPGTVGKMENKQLSDLRNFPQK